MHPTPDARLYITPGCPHCPVVLQGLTELVKSGEVGRLEVINVAQHSELAAADGVRTAPWMRLGPFVLEGAQSPIELQRWARMAGSSEGDTAYIEKLLISGGLGRAIDYVAERPSQRLSALLPLVSDPEKPIQVKLGATALFEEYEASEALRAMLPELGDLSRHADARVRTDACHLLGLSGDQAARPLLERALSDGDGEVREVASESLAALTATTGGPR